MSPSPKICAVCDKPIGKHPRMLRGIRRTETREALRNGSLARR